MKLASFVFVEDILDAQHGFDIPDSD